jgi:hypothetical protein
MGNGHATTPQKHAGRWEEFPRSSAARRDIGLNYPSFLALDVLDISDNVRYSGSRGFPDTRDIGTPNPEKSPKEVAYSQCKARGLAWIIYYISEEAATYDCG